MSGRRSQPSKRTPDTTPAMCLACGNVREYSGHQEHHSFLKCEACECRKRHAIVGVSRDWAEEALAKEQEMTKLSLRVWLNTTAILEAIGCGRLVEVGDEWATSGRLTQA